MQACEICGGRKHKCCWSAWERWRRQKINANDGLASQTANGSARNRAVTAGSDPIIRPNMTPKLAEH